MPQLGKVIREKREIEQSCSSKSERQKQKQVDNEIDAAQNYAGFNDGQ